MKTTANLQAGDIIWVYGVVRKIKTCTLVDKTDLYDIVFEDTYTLRECQNRQWVIAPAEKLEVPKA